MPTSLVLLETSLFASFYLNFEISRSFHLLSFQVGAISDMLPKNMLYSFSLLLAALFTFFLSFDLEYSWFAIKFVSSSGWICICAIAFKMFEEKEIPSVSSKLAINSRFSAIASSFLIGLMMDRLEWRQTLEMCSLLIASISLLTFFFVEESFNPNSSKQVKQSHQNCRKTQEEKKKEESLLGALLRFFSKLSFLPICMSALCSAILMEFFTILPLFLDKKGFSPSQSANAAALFPLGSCLFLFAMDKFYSSLKDIQRIFFLAISLLITFLSILLFRLVHSNFLVYLCIASMGGSVSSSYYYPTSHYCKLNGGGKEGLMVGIFECFFYFGAFLANWLAASLIQTSPSSFLNFLLISCVFCFFTTCFSLYLELKVEVKLKKN